LQDTAPSYFYFFKVRGADIEYRIIRLLVQEQGGCQTSVDSLLLSVFIIIDFAYSAHEWLIARMEAEDARLDAAGWEPGLLSNRWKVLYLSAAILLVSFTIAGLGVMFRYFAVCPLHQFFLAETLILGIMFILISCACVRG
jgi:heme/copper-type cytochrome/quinol oxidase subunit 3